MKNFKSSRRVQFMIWMTEALVLPIFIIYLFNGFKHIKRFKDIFNLQFLNTLLLTVSIYQFLLFVFNKNKKSIKQDMILSLICYLKLLIHTIENSFPIDVKIKKLSNLVKLGEKIKEDNTILINEEYREILNLVIKIVKVHGIESLDTLKFYLIEFEYSYEILKLDWYNSLLLKFFK